MIFAWIFLNFFFKIAMQQIIELSHNFLSISNYRSTSIVATIIHILCVILHTLFLEFIIQKIRWFKFFLWIRKLANQFHTQWLIPWMLMVHVLNISIIFPTIDLMKHVNEPVSFGQLAKSCSVGTCCSYVLQLLSSDQVLMAGNCFL